MLRRREEEDPEPRRIRAVVSEGPEVELETVPGSRRVVVSRMDDPVEAHAEAPSPRGSGRLTEHAEAVLAVLVAAHLRAVAPDLPLRLALDFVVEVARYRAPHSAGDERRAERERIRRHFDGPWVRPRVARIAEITGLRVAFD
jgi:hypothetical protein